MGKAIALQLAKDGFDVAVHYSANEKAARKIQESITAMGRKSKIFKADITNEQQITSLVESVVRGFDTISVLVNCASAKIPNIKFASLDWKDMLVHWDITIKGAFLIAKALLPVFELQHYGKIIHITTQYTESTPPPELAAYITAKSALNGFTKALAVEFAPKGITVNMISPGMTETGLIGDVPEKARLVAAARAPMRRLANPEDIAAVASFLASDKADYITGETIRVNGGQVML
jgi:3-oxoacyl-[acyl-carrier protein] reductase